MFALGSVQVTYLDILCLGQLVSVDTHSFFQKIDTFVTQNSTAWKTLAPLLWQASLASCATATPTLTAHGWVPTESSIATVHVTRGMRKLTSFLGVEGKTEEISHRIDWSCWKKSNVASRPCCCLIDVVVMFRRPCSSQR